MNELKQFKLYYIDDENNPYYETSIFDNIDDFLNYYVSLYRDYNKHENIVFNFSDLNRFIQLNITLNNFNDNVKYIHWIYDDTIYIVVNEKCIYSYDLYDCKLTMKNYYEMIDFNKWEQTTINIITVN